MINVMLPLALLFSLLANGQSIAGQPYNECDRCQHFGRFWTREGTDCRRAEKTGIEGLWWLFETDNYLLITKLAAGG